uniref:Uncharacterized protein n=1 Tax=Anopheles atroparvus TaxID=41427 RepID=A0A182ILR4_ANOAO
MSPSSRTALTVSRGSPHCTPPTPPVVTSTTFEGAPFPCPFSPWIVEDPSSTKPPPVGTLPTHPWLTSVPALTRFTPHSFDTTRSASPYDSGTTRNTLPALENARPAFGGGGGGGGGTAGGGPGTGRERSPRPTTTNSCCCCCSSSSSSSSSWRVSNSQFVCGSAASSFSSCTNSSSGSSRCPTRPTQITSPSPAQPASEDNSSSSSSSSSSCSSSSSTSSSSSSSSVDPFTSTTVSTTSSGSPTRALPPGKILQISSDSAPLLSGVSVFWRSSSTARGCRCTALSDVTVDGVSESSALPPHRFSSFAPCVLVALSLSTRGPCPLEFSHWQTLVVTPPSYLVKDTVESSSSSSSSGTHGSAWFPFCWCTQMCALSVTSTSSEEPAPLFEYGQFLRWARHLHRSPVHSDRTTVGGEQVP